MGLLDELCSIESYDALSNVLIDTKLHPMQTVDILKILYRKCGIFVYPTGTGKTFLAAGCMKMLLNENPDRKFIFCMKFSQLAQTPKKLERILGVKIISTSAEAKDIKNIMKSGKFLEYQVLLITHDCLNSKDFTQILFKNKQHYCCIFIDEAHNVANVLGSNRGAMISAICRQFEYRIALTATPITSDIKQLCNLANILDPSTYNNPKILEKKILNGSFSIKDDPCFFVSRTREEMGAEIQVNTYLRLIEPQLNQIGLYGEEATKACRIDGINQALDLIELLKEKISLKQRGLVFVNRHAVREHLLSYLDRENIKYCCINGNTSLEERSILMEKFNDKKEFDVVLTSVTEALDLDCNFVYFYEITLNVDQMIGRSARGLTKKSIDVYFSVTEDTGEVDKISNVIKTNKMIKRSINKSCKALSDLENTYVDLG